MELLTRLSAPVVLTNDEGSLRTWLVSYLLQSFSLAGVALFVPDDEAQPTLSPALLMGASEHIEHEEEDDGPRYTTDSNLFPVIHTLTVYRI